MLADRFSYLVIGCWLLLSQPATLHATPSSAVQVVLDAHVAAVRRLQSVQTNFVYSARFPFTSLLASGEYLWADGIVLIREGKEKVRSTDTLIQNGEIRQLGRYWSKHRVTYTGFRAPSTDIIGFADVWQGVLLSTRAPSGRRCSIDQLISESTSNPRVEAGEFGPIVLASYTTDSVERTYRVEFDASKNHLVRSLRITSSQTEQFSEATVTDFQESQPGVWMPMSCLQAKYNGNQLTGEWTMVLDKLVVNREISRNRFRLPPFPTGTKIHDRIRETRYPIDADWRAVGPAVVAVEGPAPEDQHDQAPSTEEGVSLVHWLFPMALSLGLIAMIVFILDVLGPNNP